MRNQPRNIRPTEALVDLLARRPELRDVGIAGYLAGAAVEGAPGMPPAAVDAKRALKFALIGRFAA